MPPLIPALTLRSMRWSVGTLSKRPVTPQVSRKKSLEEIEYEDVFGHGASKDAETYAGIRANLIEEAGGFGKLTAQKLALLDEQARELAARKRNKHG